MRNNLFWSYGMLSGFSILLIGLAVLVLSFVFFVWFASANCAARAVSFDQHRWGLVQGCMVLHKGRWLPLENIRGFDDKG